MEAFNPKNFKNMPCPACGANNLRYGSQVFYNTVTHFAECEFNARPEHLLVSCGRCTYPIGQFTPLNATTKEPTDG
jgi:hypothetical protein